MSSKNILIIGASGHAKVVIDIIEQQNTYKIVGLVDSFKQNKTKLFKYLVLGKISDIPKLVKAFDIHGCIIAIGDNWTRNQVKEKITLVQPDLSFITAIHPNAIIGKGVTLGEGTVVMPGVIVNAKSEIGKHCILNTGCIVEHENKIGDFCSIAPSVTLAGNVSINHNTAISLGANVIEGVKIGKHSIVGAGALVNKHIGDFKVAYGIPAKEIRDRKENEKYLGLINCFKGKTYDLCLYKIDNATDIIKYNKIKDTFKNQSVFYSLEYFNSNKDSKKLFYFVLKQNDKPLILMPVYLSKIKSTLLNEDYYDAISPYGYSGPLIKDKVTSEGLKFFWNHVDSWYKKNNVVTEFVRFNLENNYKQYTGHLMPTLDNIKGVIKPFDELWSNFKQKSRNNYRKSEKSNLSIAFYKDDNITEDIIMSFYNIYISTMKRNVASDIYFFPVEYFINLIKGNPNHLVIAIVYKDDVAISAELIIVSNDTLYSYLGGTLAEYFSYRPNDFLKIEVMKWAINENIKFYVLGGGRENCDGLYQYKKSFFPKDEDVTFYTGRKIVNPKIYETLISAINPECVGKSLENKSIYFPLYKKPC
ncbi:hypothetical protein GCM10022291_05550 [Postechiella marina]|uniref:Uncharacterized protein n=1 Tax=Postechiella marina TaxID=943941 RepID=A0ABP8C1C7_9FLAO